MLGKRSTWTASRPLVGGGVVLVSALLALSACSSSGSSSGTSGSNTSSSTTSTGSTSTSPSSGGSTQDQETSAAAALVTQYEQAPPKLSEQTPLKSKPATGKTVVQITCEVPQCQQIGKGAQEAGKALGWNVKVLTYNDQDTSTFINAMNQALQYHPVMVAITAVPQAVFEPEIAKYAAAGVPIDAQFTVADINKTVVSNPGGQVTNFQNGTMLGEWIIADSHASGHVLTVGIPSLPTTNQAAVMAAQTIQKNCSSCKVTQFAATLTQVGNNSLVPAIVSALQKDPSIKYVVSGQSGFTTALPAALKAAGISGVKLVGAAPTVPDEQQLQTGQAYAFAPLAFEFEGWQLVDVAARYLEGMPIPNGQTEGVNPTQLITKNNVGSGTPTGTLEAPVDYRDQFKQLWHVG